MKSEKRGEMKKTFCKIPSLYHGHLDGSSSLSLPVVPIVKLNQCESLRGPERVLDQVRPMYNLMGRGPHYEP